MSLRGSDGPPSGASSGAPFLQHRSQRDLWFNTSFTSAAPPKVLALDLSKTKNLDASVADTPHNSSAVSVVPVPCKILFPLLDNDYIPFKDPQGNRTVLNNLVRISTGFLFVLLIFKKKNYRIRSVIWRLTAWVLKKSSRLFDAIKGF